ncbi:hypothetical protein QOZ80_5BG0456000 [Eleusine coracana subsp. coracana]|nr:hypothetical protein QOZ80_5BG0456000 [Eleusine coracana subsp. coracana]
MDGSVTTMGSSKTNKKGDQQHNRSGRSSSTATMAMRKGPWTEEEDAQLVWFVRLFGERRWDFLAKVSGLKRTGKSCRLRWVNYLHPGLRRGRITADEERLIIELHAKWGSRWSRIARSLPGRTDNEIKNFWRTRMRKQKALGGERKCSKDDKSTAASPSSSSVTTAFFSGGSPSSSTVTESAHQGSSSVMDDEAELDEASTTTTTASQHQHQQQQPHQHQQECYTMDQLWNEIAATDAAASYNMDSWGIGHASVPAAEPPLMMPSSPVWEFCSDYSLWRIDDEEYYKKMLHAS